MLERLPLAAALAAVVLGAACPGQDPVEERGSASEPTPATSTGPAGTEAASACAEPPPILDETLPFVEDSSFDMVSTSLSLDVAARSGVAELAFNPSRSGFASFEIHDLHIDRVESNGGRVRFRVFGDRLDIDARRIRETPRAVRVSYSFVPHAGPLGGWNEPGRLSFVWPDLCGRLFPCKSDPADGLTFKLEVTGAKAGEEAVYPRSIETDAPSYMPAFALGPFARMDVGKTSANTQVFAWYLPGEKAAMQKGVKDLARVFDFFETHYGPYRFGREVGSVSAHWPPGSYGGMEHHPYWHVSNLALGVPYIHAHEAAHGWYGNGVRIQCWEDFVLSEGTASYIAARALESIGAPVWHGFECDLKHDCTGKRNTVALPPTCNAISLLGHPLLSDVPYMKGAWFYREAAKVLGADAVDKVLARFYAEHAGKAARMQDMIELMASSAPSAGDKAEIELVAQHWLRDLACPASVRDLCR